LGAVRRGKPPLGEKEADVGKTGMSKAEANVQAGAVRELAGRMKGDRVLEAKGLAQQVKGSLQKVLGTAMRAVAGDEPTK
jgi:uncharacterized protein YjbJ (UPF0337 family)